MSKLKRLLGALSLVALTVFSSCVDDEVAPEVAALRQAQVDLLNAEVAYQTALTALKNADVAFREAQTAGELIANARDQIQADEDASMLERVLAQTQVEVAKAQVQLEQQALALAQATADLQRYAAQAGLEEAAFWLAAWDELYFGDGTLPDFAQADGHEPIGIVDLRQEINNLQAEIARDELFLSGENNDSVRQAYIDAATAAALVAAQANVAMKNEELVMKEAELAALLADDPNEAVLVLEEALIANDAAEDSAQAVVTAAEAALEAAIEGPNAATLKIIADFEAADTLPSGSVDIANRVNYQTAFVDVEQDSADLALAISDTAAWWNYGDDLQDAYDANYTPYISAYDTILQGLEADTVVTYNNLVASQPDGGLEDDVLDTYNQYIVAFRRINEQAQAGTATRADTLAMVAARTAWDGLTIADLLVAGSGSAYLLNVSGPAPGVAPFTTMWPVGTGAEWLGARLDNPGVAGDPTSGGQQGVGGATAAYYNANVAGGELALHNEAKFRLEIAQDQYFAAVNQFRQLQLYIDSVKNFTSTSGVYDPDDVPTSPLSSTRLAEYSALIAQVQAAETTLAAALKTVDDKADFCELWESRGYDADCPKGDPNSLPGSSLSPNAKASQTNYSNAVTALNGTSTAAGSLSNLTYATSLQGQEAVDAYEAAIKDRDEQTQAEADSYGTAVVAASVARDAANAGLAAVKAAGDAIIDDIKDLFDAIAVIEVENSGSDGNQNVVETSWVSLVVDVQKDVADLKSDRDQTPVNLRDGNTYTPKFSDSILKAEDDVEQAEVDVLLAEQDQFDAERDLEDKRAELALRETQLTVLEAIAAEIQALVEAALAG